MKRDDVIKRVADLVGKSHTVDLKHYDRLILIDIYRVSTPQPFSNIMGKVYRETVAEHDRTECTGHERCWEHLRKPQALQPRGDTRENADKVR